jgi:prepilin-type N-terminal cleavage/methylation domain-containing protein
MDSSRNQNRAFTLIELLVVITIIGMLIAILLPALGKSKETAYRMGCLSNERQIGILTAMYQSDQKGRFPDYWVPRTAFLTYMNTPNFTSLYCPATNGKPPAVWDSDANAPYGGMYTASGGDTYAYNCHLQGGSEDRFYWWNWYVTDPPRRLRLDDLAHPERTFWSVDATSARFDLFYYAFLSGYRHGGNIDFNDWTNKPGAEGFNSGFADGHAAWIPWKAWTSWLPVWPSGEPYQMY